MIDDEKLWVGWKDISIDSGLIGETITKGSGLWEKEYTYIYIPAGYGYDGYCFLLSSKCVNESYISICDDMKIELTYAPELRESGKKYRRYKISGYELFEQVFKEYEVNFEREYEERVKLEQSIQEKKDKAKRGICVCGLYMGNVYSMLENKYMQDNIFRAYFKAHEGSRYSNKKFQKIENLKVIFIISDDISKYEFNEWEPIINAYLVEYYDFYEQAKRLKNKIEKHKIHSKSQMKYSPECMVRTNLDDINEHLLCECEKSMEEIIARLKQRIEKLRK